MKQLKEKTQPEKELERIKSLPVSDEVKAALIKKLTQVNREIKK